MGTSNSQNPGDYSTQHRPGVIIWANSIRTTMANDPGRQTLQDQIQTNGFLFLDDYVESILAGPKRDPIIELIKTPGRKRATSKKTKIVSNHITTKQVANSLWESDIEKENQVPLNSFHKALMQSKEEPSYTPRKQVRVQFSVAPSQRHLELAGTGPLEDDAIIVHDDDDEREVEMLVSSSPVPSGKFDREDHEFASSDVERPVNNPFIVPDSIAELTVIVEDDEPVDTIPLTKHVSGTIAESVPEQTEVPTERVSPGPPDRPDDAPAVEYNVPNPIKCSQIPLSTAPPAGTEIPSSHTQVDGVGGSTSSNTLSHKKGTPFFPTIGAPSPLRKSMRVPHDSVPTAPTTAAQPLTRSSWLVKAREARANEQGTKRSAILSGAVVQATEQGATIPKVKRKSGELGDITEKVMDEERKTKVAKLLGGLPDEKNVDQVPYPSQSHEPAPVGGSSHFISTSQYEDHVENLKEGKDVVASEDLMDNLRRTVEDFSARSVKSMGKSLGGNAANVLAEARATAEARIAMRHAVSDEVTTPSNETTEYAKASPAIALGDTVTATLTQPDTSAAHSSDRRNTKDRLSVSDLVSAFEGKSRPRSNEVFPHPVAASDVSANPTANIAKAQPTDEAYKSTPVEPRAVSAEGPDEAKKHGKPLSPLDIPPVFSHLLGADSIPQTQVHDGSQSTLLSTQPSMFSDGIFDTGSQGWLSSTQGTQFTDPTPSQPDQFAFDRISDGAKKGNKRSSENSHRDKKVQPTLSTDSNNTWNTAHTRFDDEEIQDEERASQVQSNNKAETDGSEWLSDKLGDKSTHTRAQDVMEYSESEMELDDDDGPSTLGNQVQQQPKVPPLRNVPQSPSVAQNLFNTASKLVSTVLGKKTKPEPLKSIQLAAAVAKKQLEDQEKKASRMKEMEARRQQILQRKLDEDKAREEKRLKEESDKKKREETEKRMFRPPIKKLTQGDDAVVKKSKAEIVIEKKPEVKKVLIKDARKDAPPSKIAKPTLNQSLSSSMGPSKHLKQTATSSALGSSTNMATIKLVPKPAEPKRLGTSISSQPPTATMGKGKGKATDNDLSDRQPSQVMQAAMQARVQAQIRAEQANQPAAFVSENIDLPDINSEYSDSDDENRVRTFDPPEWAQSPELRNALQTQSTVNPDDIFGAIRPLRMEELFKTRTSRFRARTSSANWAGTDELTAAEERAYAKRMGYTS